MTIDTEIEQIIETHGNKYRFRAKYLENESFAIQVISEDFTQRFGAEFSSSYVEEITSKSGGFKRLPVFWKMICMACKKSSKNLNIEIFSATDLQQLSTSINDSYDKLYVVISSISDFDIVRYPLPLPSAPFSNEELLATVRRLYLENTKLNDMVAEMSSIHSIQTLEKKVSMLTADYEDMQQQKNGEITMLRRKLRQLKEQKAQALASQMPRKRSPQFWERLNQKGSPRKLYQDPSSNATPKRGQQRSRTDLRRARTPKY